MRRFVGLCACLLVLAPAAPPVPPTRAQAVQRAKDPAPEPSLKLPAAVQGKVGRYIHVKATTTAQAVKWYAIDPGLEIEGEIQLKDPLCILVISDTPGTYRLECLAAQGGTVLRAVTVVTVGEPPPPGPTPGPGPNPPTPPGPAPIPAPGLRVLIIEDAKNRGKLPPAQFNVMFAQSVREFLNAKCVQEGPKKGWAIWDQGIDASQWGKLWVDAMARPRKSLPWIIISNGTGGYEGPLPADVDSTLALLRKYAPATLRKAG